MSEVVVNTTYSTFDFCLLFLIGIFACVFLVMLVWLWIRWFAKVLRLSKFFNEL